MMAGSTLHLIYDRLVSRSAFICPAFYSTSKHGGRILFYGVQRIATSRNFPPCSFQITSPSLLPVPQVMRNWMGFGLENTVIATYALHFVNEDIWILLQVGASTRELKSRFYDPSYITP